MAVEENTDPPNTLDHGKTTVNQYATKKTLAIGNLEIALLATNAVQLKTLLGYKTNKDTLWWVAFILVCASLVIQVLNACLLVLLGTDDLGKEKRQHRLVSLNNFSLILSIFVTVINVVLNVIVAIDPQLYSQTSNATKVL
jgi:ABC-type dipeptide/oligopeptide/nickel transport system permease subunit